MCVCVSVSVSEFVYQRSCSTQSTYKLVSYLIITEMSVYQTNIMRTSPSSHTLADN